MKPSLFRDATKTYRYEMEIPFSLGEYQERLKKVRSAMEREKTALMQTGMRRAVAAATSM